MTDQQFDSITQMLSAIWNELQLSRAYREEQQARDKEFEAQLKETGRMADLFVKATIERQQDILPSAAVERFLLEKGKV